MKKLILTLAVALIATIGFGQTYKPGFFLDVYVYYTPGIGGMSENADWFVTMLDPDDGLLVHQDSEIINQDWLQGDSTPGIRHYRGRIPFEPVGEIQIGGHTFLAPGCIKWKGYGETSGTFDHNTNAVIHIIASPM